jgi:hypothetical protein
MDVHQIEARRDQILEQMRAMRSMGRWSITEQTMLDKRKAGSEPVVRGPYYVLSRRQNGKTVSRRVKPGPELELARHDADEHRRFVELCQEFEHLTEQLGLLERGAEAQEKKRRKSSSRRISS